MKITPTAAEDREIYKSKITPLKRYAAASGLVSFVAAIRPFGKQILPRNEEGSGRNVSVFYARTEEGAPDIFVFLEVALNAALNMTSSAIDFAFPRLYFAQKRYSDISHKQSHSQYQILLRKRNPIHK